MKKIVLTFITLLLAGMGSLVMAQDIPLTKTIILTRPLSQDSTLRTAREYKFFLPNYFKFVKQDSTWQELTVQKSGCEMEEVFTFTDSGKTISYKEICAKVDTIPAHWEVVEVIDSSVTPTYTLVGTENMATNSKVQIKHDTLVVWLEVTVMGIGNPTANISVKTSKDSVITGFILGCEKKAADYLKLTIYETEAIAGEDYFLTAQKGIFADTTSVIVVDAPLFLNVTSSKTVNVTFEKDTILVADVTVRGIIPLDTSAYVTVSQKSDILKSETTYTGYDMQIGATLVTKSLDIPIFNKTTPIQKAETTGISVEKTTTFLSTDIIEVVEIASGKVVAIGKYGEIIPTLPKFQTYIITCSKKNKARKLVKL